MTISHEFFIRFDKYMNFLKEQKLPLCLAHSGSIGSQLTFTCSKSTIETLENFVKYVQSKQ